MLKYKKEKKHDPQVSQVNVNSIVIKIEILKIGSNHSRKAVLLCFINKKKTNIFTASLDDKADIYVEIPAFHARAGWPLYFYL